MIEALLTFKLYEKSLAKLRVATQEHCQAAYYYIGIFLTCISWNMGMQLNQKGKIPR